MAHTFVKQRSQDCGKGSDGRYREQVVTLCLLVVCRSCHALLGVSGAAKLFDCPRFRHDDDVGHLYEEAVFHNAWHLAEGAGEAWRVGDFAEVAVEDVVAFIGDVGCIRFVLALHYLRTQIGDSFRNQRFGEGDDFDGDGKLPQHGDLLGGVGYDYQLKGGRGDDLFAKHRAAAALDQVQRRVEFVSAVDGDVDLLGVLESDERDPEFDGEIA